MVIGLEEGWFGAPTLFNDVGSEPGLSQSQVGYLTGMNAMDTDGTGMRRSDF